MPGKQLSDFEILNALRRWLQENHIKTYEFAAQIGISRSEPSNWKNGIRDVHRPKVCEYLIKNGVFTQEELYPPQETTEVTKEDLFFEMMALGRKLSVAQCAAVLNVMRLMDTTNHK